MQGETPEGMDGVAHRYLLNTWLTAALQGGRMKLDSDFKKQFLIYGEAQSCPY